MAASSSSSSSSSEASEKQVLAPKRSKPSPAPKPKPFPSSADDEESSDGDEEDSTTSDSGDNSKPPTQQPLKPTSDSGSTDGDSDSESSDQAPPSPRRSSRVADPSIKPLISKPMDGSSTASTPASASIQESKKEKKTPASIIQDTKQQQQKVPDQDSGGQNRKLFQRIWSEDDEIAVLSGMIDYHAKKGLVPSSVGHMDDFRDFIQKSLQMEVSKTQLADKVRRVRNKYHTATARSKNGADPSFTKPHERTIYELSKEIWGPKKKISPGAGAGDVSKSKKRKRSKIPTTFAITTDKGNDPVKVNFPYPFLRDVALRHIGNEHPGRLIVAKMALESLDNSKALELEEKCKKQKLSEMKQDLQLLDLRKEVVKLIMDAIV